MMLVAAGTWTGAASAADTLWGIDSDSHVTDAFLNEVETVLGHPDFFGGYLGNVQRPEVDTAFAHGTALLLIRRPPVGHMLIGAGAGQAAANEAASTAAGLGAPHGVGIYQDVEQGDAIDIGFVQGWIDQLNANGYKPGFYGNPIYGAFSGAYCAAVAANGAYAQTPFWSSIFSPGRTTRAAAPAFDPAQLPCGADADLWQYGIPSTDQPGSFCAQNTCPHADTDLALASAPLWRPLPPKPSCNGAALTVAHDAPTSVHLTCSGDAFSYSPPAVPAHGTISAFDASAGTLTYTPAAGYAGPDSFTFGAMNAGGNSDTATVTITVLPPKPTCTPISTLIATDTPTAIQLSCSGQAISYTAPSAPAHGTISAFNPATGALTYTPPAGYTGLDSYTFAASNAGGTADAATVAVTIATPPAISNLKASALCVRPLRLKSAPTHGSSGLSFSYTLNQSAQVRYVLYRRDDSTRHKHCPQHATGHTQDTFTPQGTLTGPGAQGTNAVVVASSASASGTAGRRAPAVRTVRAGRHRIRLAQVTKGRLLTPGTYVLLVNATNTLAQQSNTAHVKFFTLGNRPTVSAPPVILPAPKVVQAGALVGLEVVPPANARACIAYVGDGASTSRRRFAPSGPSRMLSWTVGADARGTWGVRVTCGTSTQTPAELGSARTTIVVTRAGQPRGRLVKPGSFTVKAGLIPAAPGRVGGFQRRVVVPHSAAPIDTTGWPGCSPSAWMTKVHNVGYGLGRRESFLPTKRAKELARFTPGAYDRMWGDLQRCLGYPAVSADELDTLYAQMVCHAVYGFPGTERATGATWDFEAWHKPVPWTVSMNPKNQCGHWGDVEADAVGKQLNNRIVQSDEDTNPQKQAWLVQQENGKYVRQHVETSKAYYCLTNAGKIGAEPYPAEFLNTYLPLGTEITDSVCPAPPAGGGANPSGGPAGDPGGGPGSNPGGGGTVGCNGGGGTSAGGPGQAGFHVQDIFYGGTWARTDPCTGAWSPHSAKPANAAYWYPNGLGVGVDCARTGALYTVRFADGHSETWGTWFHVTDGKWFPSAAAQEISHDGFQGLPAC